MHLAPLKEALAVPPRVMPRSRERAWRSWPGEVVLGATLAFGAGWLLSTRTEDEPSQAQASRPLEARDGGTVALGDSALTAPAAPTPAPTAWTTISTELPPKPFPGQRRPNANGRCPSKSQVAINGGCWHKVNTDLKDCDTDAYVYKGACYAPVLSSPRPSTSNPANRPDKQAR